MSYLYIILPLVSLAIGIIAGRKILTAYTKNKFILIPGGLLIMAGSFLLPIMLINLVFPNPSVVTSEKYVDSLAELSPDKICGNEDGGNGISNSIPWSTGYFLINENASVEDFVKDKASPLGYQLQENTEYIEQLKVNNRFSAPEDTQLSPSTTYLVGYNDKRVLEIKIIREGEVPLYCSNGGEYGRMYAAPDDKDILAVSHSEEKTY